MQLVNECYRGRNVRVFRLDRDAAIAALRRAARALMAANPTVVEVRLFGSLARGQGAPGSDADLFVVVRNGAGPFLDRIPEVAGQFAGLGIGCDVIVYTETEYAALAERKDAFSRAVLDEGVTLARRERAGSSDDRSPRA